tara:strand:- start:74 stop:772 length:699 start_codon:yes stop_codon:yes gene_type:complete
MNTKIYCDIADLDTIKKFTKKKIVKGFTTNPSLMRKAGAKNYKSYSKKILNIIKSKPVSFEVFADNKKDMIRQANVISSWGRNVYVKVPLVNSKGQFMGDVIKYLTKNRIKINITAVYNFQQVLKIIKNINKNSDVIISMFVGRAGDVGKNPIPELKKILKLTKPYKKTKILWASVREPYNYIQARELGFHVITVPPSIIEKIEKFGKNYNDLTIETVKGFLNDSKQSRFKI